MSSPQQTDTIPQQPHSPTTPTAERDSAEPSIIPSIQYTPITDYIGFKWDSALDLLCHLANCNEDRKCLLDEAHCHFPDTQTTVYIDHPLLRTILITDSKATDEEFVKAINALIWQLESSSLLSQIQHRLDTRIIPILAQYPPLPLTPREERLELPED